jgi:hypothetical protein
MAVAFHLLTHRQPDQVAQLLESLWHGDNTYVLHHDRRRPRAEHAAIAGLAARFGKNVIVQKPTAVLWGRFSLYAAQHEGAKLALASNRPWTHWLNVSGQCHPLQSPARIQQILANAGDVSFVRHFRPLENGDWTNPEGRLTRRYIDSPALEWWVRLRGIGPRLRRLLFGSPHAMPFIPGVRRALPTTFTWYGGDNWVALSRAAAEYLVHSPNAAHIIGALRHSSLPEESIFQSVLMNSPLAPQVRNEHLRCINWLPGVGSPGIFKDEDFLRLKQAAADGALVARKFDPRIDATVIDRIKRELLAG